MGESAGRYGSFHLWGSLTELSLERVFCLGFRRPRWAFHRFVTFAAPLSLCAGPVSFLDSSDGETQETSLTHWLYCRRALRSRWISLTTHPTPLKPCSSTCTRSSTRTANRQNSSSRLQRISPPTRVLRNAFRLLVDGLSVLRQSRRPRMKSRRASSSRAMHRSHCGRYTWHSIDWRTGWSLGRCIRPRCG